MSALPSHEVVDRRDALIATAASVLAQHTPDEYGLCAGCMSAWSRWVPFTGCTQVQWARRVLETHGVADSDWSVADVLRNWFTTTSESA